MIVGSNTAGGGIFFKFSVRLCRPTFLCIKVIYSSIMGLYDFLNTRFALPILRKQFRLDLYFSKISNLNLAFLVEVVCKFMISLI